MKTIAAGVFKVKCLAIMDEVQARRETVIITKHGRAVAKLIPAGRTDGDIFHFLCDKGSIKGDVVAPAMSREEWGDLL